MRQGRASEPGITARIPVIERPPIERSVSLPVDTDAGTSGHTQVEMAFSLKPNRDAKDKASQRPPLESGSAVRLRFRLVSIGMISLIYGSGASPSEWTLAF